MNPRGLNIPKLFKSFAFGRSAIPPRLPFTVANRDLTAALRTGRCGVRAGNFQGPKWSLMLWIQLSAASQASLAASRLCWPSAPPAG